MLRPFSLRRRMAMDVSNMGMLSKTTGTARVNPAAFLADDSSARAPIRKPSGRLPESPRKIRAGGQLNNRNPTRAPDSIVASEHPSPRPGPTPMAAPSKDHMHPPDPS